MERIPEAELMEDAKQALAYAEANFQEQQNHFMHMFQDMFGNQPVKGHVLDLGCGPGDITIQFAKTYPDCIVHGVDGSEAMLQLANKALAETNDLHNRVEFIHAILPETSLPRQKYNIIISNSLLHHFHNPQLFWDVIQTCSAPKAIIFIVDLKRVETPAEAQEIVNTYAKDESELLKEDFYNSLLAAFEVDEVKTQLKTARLDGLSVSVVSERHLAIMGYKQ